MYKVFLVDDEIVVREGIRSNFPWENSDFELVGEAPDGEIALSMLQDIRPDILITDIRMPFMDGLELCRAVSATMPWLYIVILSGYDDFAYAQEAISLGVKEYLLKPVSGEELLQVLNRIGDRISEDKRRQASMRSFKDQIASSSQLLREKLLSDLLCGADANDILSRARALQMSLVARQYLCMLVDPARDHAEGEEMNAMQRLLCRLADSSGGAALVCSMHDFFAMIVMGDDAHDLEERTYGLAQAVQYDVEKNTSFHPLLAIGPAVTQLNQLTDSFVRAREILRRRALRSAGPRIVDTQEDHEIHSLPLADLKALPIYEQLKLAKQDDAGELLDKYVESFGETAAQSKLMANYILVDVVLAASRIIREGGGEPQQVIPDALSLQGLENARSLDEALSIARDALKRALAFRDDHDDTRYSRVIRQAKAYIGEHFKNPDLTLHDVADYVALSNNHFCTVFSQETGVTFTEYITNVRIEKAMELLRDSALRTSDVAFQVGYNDPHYFSYLFKKTVGVTPRDYRREDAPAAGLDGQG